MSHYKKTLPRCYETHKALQIGDYQVYGGNCAFPMVTDADVYVGLDHSMRHQHRVYPWQPKPEKEVIEVHFLITDMSAPSDPKLFKEMITWLAIQVQLGKKVHVGCIGGHGRTGTVLSALYNELTGDTDSTNRVRDGYCQKAVESKSQIHFLHKHFGIEPVKPTKDYSVGSQFPSVTRGGSYFGDTVNFPSSSERTANRMKNYSLNTHLTPYVPPAAEKKKK